MVISGYRVRVIRCDQVRVRLSGCPGGKGEEESDGKEGKCGRRDGVFVWEEAETCAAGGCCCCWVGKVERMEGKTG